MKTVEATNAESLLYFCDRMIENNALGIIDCIIMTFLVNPVILNIVTKVNAIENPMINLNKAPCIGNFIDFSLTNDKLNPKIINCNGIAVSPSNFIGAMMIDGRFIFSKENTIPKITA